MVALVRGCMTLCLVVPQQCTHTTLHPAGPNMGPIKLTTRHRCSAHDALLQHVTVRLTIPFILVPSSLR
jgi:hypothetical protein